MLPPDLAMLFRLGFCARSQSGINMALELKFVVVLVLLANLTGKSYSDDGGEREECEIDEDCESEAQVCCRNNICCSVKYYQSWKTKCYSDEDCENVHAFFAEAVSLNRCCARGECCSDGEYDEQPDRDRKRADRHFKFRIIVAGVILATVILISTIVAFWCSGRGRCHRRPQAPTYRSSIYENSRDDNVNSTSHSVPPIIYSPERVDQQSAEASQDKPIESTPDLEKKDPKPPPTYTELFSRDVVADLPLYENLESVRVDDAKQ